MRRIALALCLAGACATPPPPVAPMPRPPREDLTRWVDPFVGTRGAGNTFPGAAAPFGMVQLSPDTGGTAGYDHDHEVIQGFSHTHLSGVGCPALGDVSMMPTAGEIALDRLRWPSRFSHADEEARPGYYRVRLADPGIGVELTATPRTGWHRYTFPPGARANVLLLPRQALQRVFEAEARVAGDREIEGRVKAGGFCAGAEDRHTTYFVARFDRPFAASGTFSGGAWATLDTAKDARVVVKVGISYRGVEGARRSLAAETDDLGFDFDRARARLAEAWNERLHAIEIDGGAPERRTAFYTALYHAMLHPNLFGDAGERRYANFSLWDTYRPHLQLLELVAPDEARDMLLSLLDEARDEGWLPKWSLLGKETNVMTGDPVTPFLVEGWSRGLLAGHEEEAYALLRKNATERAPDELPQAGRAGIDAYARRGYVPAGIRAECKFRFGDDDCAHPASATLEYAAADAALATMARALGKEEDARLFAGRARAYRNLWDRTTMTFRPRTRAGTWVTPYDPLHSGRAFHEGGAHPYTWMVPHDVGGLVALLGGPKAAEKRLDAFFAYEGLLADPAKAAREAWVRGPYEYYGKPTYNPNNEPDLLAPWVYAWAGAPNKTSTVVRAAWTLFTAGPDGMTGNDDLGTMSAWYVLSSLGLYPTTSGEGFYVLSAPQFERARVRGITIEAPGVSERDRYVASADIDGRPWPRAWVRWEDLRRGAKIAYRVAAEPGTWGAEPPPSLDAPIPERREIAIAVDDVVLPASQTRQTATTTVSVLAHAPGSVKGTLSLTAPPGWKLEPDRIEIDLASDGLPAQREVAVRVSAPPALEGKLAIGARLGADRAEGAIVVQAARCAVASKAACAVDLAGSFDKDATCALGERCAGPGFDGSRRFLDAALLPPAGEIVVVGVGYVAPDPTGAAKNVIEARGQTILLPARRVSEARVLGAAHHHGVARTATIVYEDGSRGAVPLRLSDWSGGPEYGEDVGWRMARAVRDGVATPEAATLFVASLPVDPTKTVRAIVLPDERRIQIYALTLLLVASPRP